MRRVLLACLVLVFGLSVAIVGFAAATADRDAIKKQVDEIVMAMNGGKKAADFTDAAKKEPYYVFVMEENGNMVVHPSLAGQNIKEKMAPVYAALAKATADGAWVDYEWQGKMKHSYVRKTKDNMIVGSGYSE